MKKLVALLALTLVIAFATGSYAEVQNVKVGGDIRIRALYSQNIATLNDSDSSDEYGYIQQRTRVIVEADLTDNVAVCAVVEAENYWGLPAYLTVDEGIINLRREWSAGISEAWVQLSELYYSPLTVKLGRQYLNYGTGFIISSAEYENNFDAVRAILNFDPWTVDLVYSKLVETLSADNDIDLWGGNVRYTADTWTVEGYVWGAVDNGYQDITSSTALVVTKDAADLVVTDVGLVTTTTVFEPEVKPVVFGIRGDITPIENLDLWGEVAYETGKLLGADLSAFAADVGGTYCFADVTWRPTIGLAYTFAQGDSNRGDCFYEFFEYDYYGYCYSPLTTNIHIINANLMVEPIEKLALILDYYHYIQDSELAMSMGDPYQDNGGVAAVTNGTDKGLGNEVDVIAEYDYTEDVSTQLYLAWFWPGDAYSSPNDDDAYEIRGEIIVSF